MPGCILLIMLAIPWAYWVCSLVSIIDFGKFLAIIIHYYTYICYIHVLYMYVHVYKLLYTYILHTCISTKSIYPSMCHVFFSVLLCLSFSFGFAITHICYFFGYCPVVIGCCAYFHAFFSLHFSSGSFHWSVFKLSDSFLSCVSLTDEPIRWASHSYYNVFNFWKFLS